MYALGFIAVCVILFFILSNSQTLKNFDIAPQKNLENLNQLIKESGAEGVKFISYNCKSASIIDENKEKIFVYYVKDRDSYNHFSFDYDSFNISDLIESELTVNNQTITKTARGGQIAGVAIGGALLGGIGAIIGGLSGSKKSTDRINNIEIKLTVNNLHNPIHKINFLNNELENYSKIKNGFKQEHHLCKNAIEQAEKWQGMFDVILKNNS